MPWAIPLEVHQRAYATQHPQNDENVEEGFVIAAQPAQDRGAVQFSERRNGKKANATAERKSRQKLLFGVLHDPRGHKHGNQRKWRRDNRTNGNGRESTFFKFLVNLLCSSLADLLLHSFLAALFGQSVSNIAPDHGSHGTHQAVVPPPFAMM